MNLPRRLCGGRLASPVAALAAMTALLLLVALAAVSWVAVDASRSHLTAEIAATAQAQAASVGRKIERALDYGIPAEDLVGFASVHAALAAEDPTLAFAAVTAPDGRPLHVAGGGMTGETVAKALGDTTGDTYFVTRLPLSTGGALVLGHDLAAVMKPIVGMWFDIAIVLVVALALSFELMLLVVTLNVILPARVAERVLADAAAGRFGLLHGQVMRDEMGRFMTRLNGAVTAAAKRVGATPVPLRLPRLVGVRLLAFLFVFAEELARPIMPLFFAEVAGDAARSNALSAGIAMAVPMVVVALAMPIGSALYQQVSRIGLYVGGALCATAGLAGTALLADGLWSLVAWRSLSGLGYAATFIACQGFVIESTADADRGRGTAMMVSGIMLADICGPAIGGIIAGHLGHAETFLLGAAMAAVAAVAGFVLLDRATHGDEAPPRPSLGAVPAVLGNGRLVGLLLLGAVPAKLILTGFLYFLVPMALAEDGVGSADVGRIIMLYGLAAVVAGPVLARFADARAHRLGVVAGAGVATGLGLVSVGWLPGLPGMMVAVATLGLAQSLSIATQLAAALDVSQEAIAVHGKGPVLALLRLVERLGAAAGPLVAAGLAATFGTEGAIWQMGVGAAVAGCLLLLLHVRVRGRARMTGRTAA